MKEMEKVLFCRQMSKVLKAGMTFEEGMILLAEDETKEGLLNSFKSQIEDGKHFLEVFKETKFFSEVILEMLETGLETGQLEKVLNTLGDYYERESKVKETIKQSVVYPGVLGSILLVVQSILFIKVMPIFEQVFNGMGVSATGITKWLFDWSFVIGSVLAGLLVAGWSMAGILYGMSHHPAMQRRLQSIYQRTQLAKLTDYFRLTDMVSLMMGSGIAMQSALIKGKVLVRNQELLQKLTCFEAAFYTSYDLGEALKASDLFTSLIRRSVLLGVMAGHLEETFQEVAKDYESKLRNHLAHQLGLIEPIIVGTMSVLVGLILLSVMMPLMNMMSQL